MLFGEEVANAEAVVRTGGSKSFPVAKGYNVVIVSSEFRKEDKNGNSIDPQLILKVDIADGEFEGIFSDKPKWKFMDLVGLDKWGKSKGAKTKEELSHVVNQNIGIFTENEDIFSGDFDESRLIGCVVGCVFKWDYKDPRFVIPDFFCTREYAADFKERPKPKTNTVQQDFTVTEEAPKPKSLFGK